MMLSRYGRREWTVITVIAVAAAIGFGWLGWWWMLPTIAVIWIVLVAFFRDPSRVLPTDLPHGTMLAPADGVISAIERVDEHDATGGPAVIIRIFLSVLDVHVNRAPYDGAVVSVVHSPGKYLDARTAESARLNESNLLTLRSLEDPDETFGVRQVAGKVARRIVCAVKIGDSLARGEKYGMIKFGSTTELILPRPDDVTVHVHVGDRVQGGLTMLATLRPRAAARDDQAVSWSESAATSATP